MPRPLIFDLYNTLVNGANDERKQVVGEMAVVLGVAPTDLIGAYEATWHDRLVRWDVEETIRILVRRVGGRPDDEQVAQAAAMRLAFAGRLLDTVPSETLDVLDGLRAGGHPIALISNATADTAEAWAQSRLADRFDVVVFSCVVGLAKPDPAIYGLAAQRLGADPAECVFVGDGADDELAGAAGVGMTVLRTREHTDSDPQWNGPVVDAFKELRPLLRQLVVDGGVRNSAS
jgi:putative hydrolase of the HAD superfamily